MDWNFKLPDNIKTVSGFNDNARLNKEINYFLEVEIEVEDLNDMDFLINDELAAFSPRVMNTPETFAGPTDLIVRFDFEDEDEIDMLADFLYENDYIDDEEYTDFEDLISEYE